MVDARSPFVDSGDEECDSVGPGHGFLFGGGVSLSEVECEIGDGLGECLDCDGLEIGISMIQSLNSSVFDEGTSIGDDTTGGTTDMGVDLEDFLDGFGDDEGGVESSLDGEHDSLGALDADG